MYLYKRTYVQNWEHMTPDERHSVTVKKAGKKVEHIDTKKVAYIIETAGYWRKANAIHNWMVKNVQEGNDNCGEYYVSEDNMRKLLELVDRVLEGSELVSGKIQNGYTFKDGKRVPIMADGKYIKDATLAHQLLPTTEGFFFGSTEYNEWYLDDLKDTKKILEDALKMVDVASFYYSSSW